MRSHPSVSAEGDNDLPVFASRFADQMLDPFGGDHHHPTVSTITLADFDGNGSADLLTGSRLYENLSIMLNDGFGDLGRFGNAGRRGWSLLSLNSLGSAGSNHDAYLPIE